MPDYSAMQKEYAMYRIERAKEDLDAAQLLFEAGNYRIANNRAYYAIFHAMRAVLVFDNFDICAEDLSDGRDTVAGECPYDRFDA